MKDCSPSIRVGVKEYLLGLLEHDDSFEAWACREWISGLRVVNPDKDYREEMDIKVKEFIIQETLNDPEKREALIKKLAAPLALAREYGDDRLMGVKRGAHHDN